MVEWSVKLNYNPVPTLLKGSNEDITVFTERDLLDNTVSTEDLWQLPESRRILRKQNLMIKSQASSFDYQVCHRAWQL